MRYPFDFGDGLVLVMNEIFIDFVEYCEQLLPVCGALVFVPCIWSDWFVKAKRKGLRRAASFATVLCRYYSKGYHFTPYLVYKMC